MVAVFAIEGTHLRKQGEAKIGGWSQGAVFSADSKTLLVGNMIEKDIGVYRIDPNGVVDTVSASSWTAALLRCALLKINIRHPSPACGGGSGLGGNARVAAPMPAFPRTQGKELISLPRPPASPAPESGSRDIPRFRASRCSCPPAER